MIFLVGVAQAIGLRPSYLVGLAASTIAIAAGIAAFLACWLGLPGAELSRLGQGLGIDRRGGRRPAVGALLLVCSLLLGAWGGISMTGRLMPRSWPPEWTLVGLALVWLGMVVAGGSGMTLALMLFRAPRSRTRTQNHNLT
jgi:hypothetical protein